MEVENTIAGYRDTSRWYLKLCHLILCVLFVLSSFDYPVSLSTSFLCIQLKPANIFIDNEENIRLGDFGLATSDSAASSTNPPPLGNEDRSSMSELEADVLDETIDSPSSSAQIISNNLTGGVGTTFYMAPEQERSKFTRSKHGKGSYDSKADIFSLGVLLFEMFLLKPIPTFMERAVMLTALRGEERSGMLEKYTPGEEEKEALFSEEGEIVGDWKHVSEQRFPESFRTNVSLNAQKIILWCLEQSPKRRPSAKQLLQCDLLPRKVELEEKYLNEVLQTLSNPQSELQSYQQILSKLFDFPTPASVLTTYDSEVSVSANQIDGNILTKSLNRCLLIKLSF